MDILIDLIIYAVKQMTKDRPPRITPASFQQIEQQKAATEQRIREMQTAIANQQGRAKPARSNRGPSRAAATVRAPAPARSVSQAPDTRARTAPASSVPVVTHVHSQTPRRDFRIPLIFGEILAPPLALRDTEF
jgi:hypothetical protein